MENTLVSIIVPVYNAEKYLNECIDSIIGQTYRNIQIILIDDGSKDHSPALCDSYALKDERITVIHKENGGVSSARNEGIALAAGEYLMFVDSDDTIENDAVEVLLAGSQGSEWVVGSFVSKNNRNQSAKLEPIVFEIADNKAVSINDVLPLTILRSMNEINHDLFNPCFSKGPLLTGPWLKLYRKSIIENEGLLFDPSLTVGEDCFFNAQYALEVHTICFFNYGIYNYRENENSIMHNIINHITKWNAYYEKVYPLVEKYDMYGVFYRKILSVVYRIIRMYAVQIKTGKQSICVAGRTLKKICSDPYCKMAIAKTSVRKLPGAERKMVLFMLKSKMYKLTILSSMIK